LVAGLLEQGKNFDIEEFKQWLEKLAEFEPSLRQQRPNDPLPIPELPVDPVTGARVPQSMGKGNSRLREPEGLRREVPASGRALAEGGKKRIHI